MINWLILVRNDWLNFQYGGLVLGKHKTFKFTIIKHNSDERQHFLRSINLKIFPARNYKSSGTARRHKINLNFAFSICFLCEKYEKVCNLQVGLSTFHFQLFKNQKLGINHFNTFVDSTDMIYFLIPISLMLHI